MMADEWLALQPPTTCGKRPRSPVDKLADLAASAEDDEQDWRSSKRYLTEVIASGFSKLSFKLGMPPHHQQQQQAQQAGAGLDAASQLQQQSSLSPKSSSLLPGQLGAQPLQVPESTDCPMDMQMSPPMWPPQSQGQQQQQPQKAAFAGPSPSSSTAGGVLGGGISGGAWAQQDGFAGQQGLLPQGAFTGRRTPSPEPSSSQPAGSPRIPAPPAADASGPLSPGAAAAAAAAAGPSGLTGEDAGGCSSKPGLAPLQTAKVLRAAEKQPNSPSDLPAASLRKVALLRSLLARAEQQFHQQQGGTAHHQPQPTRMQQGSGTQASALQQQDPQQHQQQDEAAANRPPWMQPWGVLPSSSQGQEQQQQLPALPPRPVTPWEMSSDDMDCSSASSVVESETSSSQQGPLDPGLQIGMDQDQAASALLCREVLFPAGDNGAAGAVGSMHAHDQQSYGGRARHNMQLPFFNQGAAEPVFGPAVSHTEQQQQQGLGQCGDAGSSGGSSLGQPPLPPQHQQRRSSMLAARQGSPELSRQKLEELRAKALASTHQLTCLTQEDLHSLQLGLASRRGSVDSHTPSGLQPAEQQQRQGVPSCALPPALRRHSSHF